MGTKNGGAERVKIGKTGQAAEKKDLNGPNRAVCRRGQTLRFAHVSDAQTFV